MISINKIVCPTDFSEPSYAALAAANGLALQYSSELYVVHVVAPLPSSPFYATENFDVSSYEEKSLLLAKNLLKDVVDQKVSKDLNVYPVVKLGYAPEEIINVAEQEKAELIVISTHGSRGWNHLIFGSVTEKIIRLATCAVLVVRAPQKKS
jgi:nucleotide-binding universal stress UspA family protein